MICLLHDFWKELGLKNIELHINNIGDPNERSEYRKQLIKYFEQHKDQLDEDASRRLHSNPMRILDSKNPKMQSIIDHAPKFVDGMSGASKTHFEKVLGYLEQQNIPYTINKNLVRGLDYYNRTVFEWVSNDLGSQGTVAGGGRYDYLIGSMCNTEIPAFGVGIGIERIILLLEQLDHVQNYSQPSVYLVNMGHSVDQFTLQVANVLRNQGISTSMNIGSTSFKSQLKKADKSGASFAIIIGDDEVKKKVVQIKLLRKTMDQQEVLLNNIVDFIKNNAH